MLYGPNSSTNKFRTRRFGLFRRLVDDVVERKGTCRIVDIGGTRDYWEAFGGHLPWHRIKLTIVNLRPETDDPPAITAAVADARDLSQFHDDSFDVVHSNSVIEHVGGWRDMQRMAQEVRRIGMHYFVQTPYFWFPVDPHTRTPLFHWMPDPVRYRIAMVKDCGFWKRCETVSEAMEVAEDARLLDTRQMSYLFPDAEIMRERMFGMTKSLVAIRH
jgi:hypothetical protein